MQSTCLTVWDRGIRESGVRVCMCVPESKSKREQEREKGERDFDGEVWTCVSRLTSVAPDRHTQAQRHTYRGLWHIPEADQSSVHALQWAIVLHILKWALGTELSPKTCCAQSQRARTFTHTHTHSAAKSWILRVKTKMCRSQQTMTPVSLVFQLEAKLFYFFFFLESQPWKQYLDLCGSSFWKSEG